MRWISMLATAVACAPGGKDDDDTSKDTKEDSGEIAGATPAEAGCGTASGPVTPLKDAKLNIEHNATDADSGFQGFVDSEGWSCLQVTGPDGPVLTFRGDGSLADHGLTELFFETVEPANADIPLDEILQALPEGDYVIEGPGMEAGESTGWTSGTAWLTHDIPQGPALLTPKEGAEIPPGEVVFTWAPVTMTLDGSPIDIVSYQLIVEVDEEPHPHQIGKMGLQMYVPPTTLTITVSPGFLVPNTAYNWEVLAIEESGNQTLSSGTFHTAP